METFKSTGCFHQRGLKKRANLYAVSSLLGVLLCLMFSLTVTASAEESPAAAPSLVVKLVDGLSTNEQSEAIARNGGVEIASIPALRLHTIAVPAGELSSVLSSYQDDPLVERVEVNRIRKVEGAALPPDPFFPYQWALPKIGWDTVFGSALPSGTATVAVLDTGVDASHPDLKGVVISGTSLVDGSNGLSDANGHGTLLAGIVAALPNNEGIAGVGYAGVRIMPVKVLGADGTGQDSDIIAGITYAVDQGAKVILMGFSNPGFSQNLQDAVDYAWSKNVVLVASTGNDGTDVPAFPAGLRGVIGVSATDQADNPASFNNYGPAVFLAAPGTEILSTATGDSYASLNGTSASAAIVAGVAAFLYASDPALTNGVVAGRLARTADPAGSRERTGNGRVNMARALADTGTEEFQPAGGDPVGNGGPWVGPYLVAGLAGNGEGTMTVSPVSALVGSTGNSFAFTFTSPVNDFGANSQVTFQVPPGWTPPQSTNPANPGYVAVSNVSCTSASLSSITGTGPWMIVVTMNCLNKQSFMATYAGGGTKVTAPETANTYVFTTRTKQGAGGILQDLVNSPVVAATSARTSIAVSSSLNPSVRSDSVTFTATVTPIAPTPSLGTVPTGNVVFGDSTGILATVPLDSSGKAVFTTANLWADDNLSHDITASYTGDLVYVGSQTVFSQAVKVARTSMALSSSLNPSVFSDSVTFTATVTPAAPIPVLGTVPTGNVDFYRGSAIACDAWGWGVGSSVELLGSAPINGSGQAVFTTSSLPADDYQPQTVTACYRGDTIYVGSRSVSSQTVKVARTSIAVASSLNPSVRSDSVTFTATVTPTAPTPFLGTVPTGNLVFADSTGILATVPLDSSGKAVFTTSNLWADDNVSHDITVSYTGDLVYVGSQTVFSQVVKVARTSIAVSSSLNPSVYSDAVTFTATVTPVAPIPVLGTVPTGDVNFYVGTDIACDAWGWGVGSYAYLLGSASINGSGQAILTTSILGADYNHPQTVTACYRGDAIYVGSRSVSSQIVQPARTSITISSSSNPSIQGDSVTFTATVTPIAPTTVLGTVPTGTVTFFDNDDNSCDMWGSQTSLTPPVPIATAYLDANGQATFTTPGLAADYTIIACYRSDAIYIGTKGTFSQTVVPATSLALSSSKNPSGYGEPVSFTAVVSLIGSSSGTPTGWVQFKIDGSNFGSPVALAGGSATSDVISSLSAGSHTITAEYKASEGPQSNIAMLSIVVTSVNEPPVADAGINVTILSQDQYSRVVLGSATDLDSGVLKYRWREDSTVLADWSPVGPLGEAPLDLSTVAQLSIGIHYLILEIDDGISTAGDEMILTVDNAAPNAVASGDGTYQYGTPVPLGGQVSDFDGDLLSYEWVEGSTVLFKGDIAAVSGGTPVTLPVQSIANLSIGAHTLVLRVRDATHIVESEVAVAVMDRTAPTLSPKADKSILWPPDHRMATITIAANGKDDSAGTVTLSAVVTSNEPQDGLGDGDISPDFIQPVIDQAAGLILLQLRAERSGKGDGRVYTITVTATDPSGNSSSADVGVLVPHDMKKK